MVGRSQLAAQAAAVGNGDARPALYDAVSTRFLAGEEPIAPDPGPPEGAQALLQSLARPANPPSPAALSAGLRYNHPEIRLDPETVEVIPQWLRAHL